MQCAMQLLSPAGWLTKREIICHRSFTLVRLDLEILVNGYRIGGAAESKPNIKRELHMYSDKVLR